MVKLNQVKTLIILKAGYKLNGSRDVFIKVYIKKRKVEIIIQDYGVGIKNLDEALCPSFSTNKENEHAGMGFIIMQTLSDDFEVKSYPGLGTKLVIMKELTPLSEEVY